MFETTSPYTRRKSERTKALASTSRRTSPSDRYNSDVIIRTTLRDVGRHHLDFLKEGDEGNEQIKHKEHVEFPYFAHPFNIHTPALWLFWVPDSLLYFKEIYEL